MSITEKPNSELIGRAELNDIEAILAITNTDVDEVEHIVKNNADSIFTWDYSLARPHLRKLYEKAKVGQWNGATDLDWSIGVDIEKTIAEDAALIGNGMEREMYADTKIGIWGDKEWLEFGIEGRRWQLSQFLHGEQGALICTSKIVETVPWYDPKLYASTQVVDEARHVAFGVLSLKEVYDGMSDAEMKDRQEFAYEASVRMRDRFLQQEVWDRMGVSTKELAPIMLQDPARQLFQQMLFAKIVPNCKKLGLLDRNDKWLRHKFEEMGVIQFEDWQDTAEEFTDFELGKEMPTIGQ